jgi:hypothetical protein
MSVTELRYISGGQWLRRGYSSITTVQGTPISANTDLVAAVAAGSTNQTFVLTASSSQPYRISSPLAMKAGQMLYSNTGSVIKGSVTVTGWQSDGAGHWYKDGLLPANYSDGGVCNINSGSEANPCQKREDVFRDNVQLKRFMTLANLVGGGFYEDYSTDRTYLADDPNGHIIEVSTCSYAINTTITGGKLQGISFQHFASPSQQAAVQIQGNNWLVDNCDFSYNHAMGFRFANSDNSTVQNSTMTHNGQMGSGCYSCYNTQFLNNEMSYNNYMGDYWALDWESGGIKFAQADTCLYQGNYNHHNGGVGIWYDIDNQNNTCNNNRSWDNVSCGIRYEISYDAIISNNDTRGYGHKNTAWRNGTDGGPFATGGINVNCSGGGYTSMGSIEIFGNYSEDDQNMIHIQARAPVSGHVGDPYYGRGPSAKYSGRFWTTQNVHVHDNTVVRRDFSDDTGSYGSAGIGTLNISSDVPYHSMGNTFANNTYYFSSTAKTRMQGYRTGVSQNMTFAQWITTTGGDGSFNDINGSVNVAARTGMRVISSGDDGTWADVTTTNYSSTTTTNAIGDFDASTAGRCVWMRIQVNIPAGVTINTATLDLLPRGINGAIPSVIISAHKTANSAQPTSRSDVSGRSLTSATVSWTPSSWTIGTWVSTPSIASIVQELVNQPGWSDGNYATFFIKPSVIGWSGTQQYISVTPYDYDANSSAGLVADWS